MLDNWIQIRYYQLYNVHCILSVSISCVFILCSRRAFQHKNQRKCCVWRSISKIHAEWNEFEFSERQLLCFFFPFARFDWDRKRWTQAVSQYDTILGINCSFKMEYNLNYPIEIRWKIFQISLGVRWNVTRFLFQNLSWNSKSVHRFGWLNSHIHTHTQFLNKCLSAHRSNWKFSVFQRICFQLNINKKK